MFWFWQIILLGGKKGLLGENDEAKKRFQIVLKVVFLCGSDVISVFSG